ncbi:hypothetical protein FOA43_000420 [Brettanomyces nanus]|uniref:Hsp70 nucleotide exchange factor FES1 n=1 Tax=Eeniella nana TaxID=13502 RepID=A0A875RYI4_EENNA|nr:uncharacterized protein FOA43_000420 [Brettanomyces nanus]QPG73115.1 hypothetical protein FOA43_000420 [Brettanomyces nanus]
MDGLLKWSLAQQGGNDEAKERAGKPDPNALAQLLGMGHFKDDPSLMKESAEVLNNKESTKDQLKIAFGNMELLIENLDNANNLKNMDLWPAVLQHLNNEDPDIQALACSCIGSAVQNNPRSQNDFLDQCKSSNSEWFDTILKHALDTDPDHNQLKMKALYALSSITRHNATAYKLFEVLDGWKVVSAVLNDAEASSKLKLRALSLLTSLLSEEEEDADLSSEQGREKIRRIQEDKVVDSMIKTLDSDGDINCNDRIIHLLAVLISHGYKFKGDEVSQISLKLKQLEPIKDRLNEDDLKTLKSVLS